MDKDIDKNILDDEEIENIVYDDNDTEADVSVEDDEINDDVDEEIDSNEQDTVDEDYVGYVDHGDHNEESNDRQVWKIALVVAAIVIVIGSLGLYYFVTERNKRYDNLLNVNSYYEGVYVDDISLGGLTKEEAVAKLEEENKKKLENVNITLLWDEEKIKYNCEEFDVAFDTEQMLGKAWQVGRSGERKDRYNYVMSLIDNPIHFKTTTTVDPSPIEAKVRATVLFREKLPGEAAVEFNPNSKVDKSKWFTYSEPDIGIQTDPDALWLSITNAFDNKTYGEIEIPKWEVVPTVTIDDLKQMTQQIVKFKSKMSKNRNREHNIRLACSMINGTILLPGEEFSMNQTTGKRTKSKGYREASIIVGGNQLVPGIAGGVCQVSGTLFNAVVRADLEITERHHHSFELSYLKRGRDATVNYGTADLRFKNNKDTPMYISMYTIGLGVYAEIYGMPLPDGQKIELYVKTTRTEKPGPMKYIADKDVPVAKSPMIIKARTGIKCTSYKNYYDKDGKLIEQVPLFNDYYKPQAAEHHYNPAKPPGSATP
jgi:vancomycin resistance protein YoaR